MMKRKFLIAAIAVLSLVLIVLLLWAFAGKKNKNEDTAAADTTSISVSASTGETSLVITSNNIVTDTPTTANVSTGSITTQTVTTPAVTTEAVTTEAVTTKIVTTSPVTTKTVTTRPVTSAPVTTKAVTTSVVTTVPVTTVPLKTAVPTVLPGGTSFTIKNVVGLDSSSGYTISGNSSASASFSTDKAAKGGAVRFGPASASSRGEIRVTPSDPINIGGASGVMFYVDFSATRPQSSSLGPCATVTLNANDYRSLGGTTQDLAYYYLNGEWHGTNCAVKDRMQLPVGFAGWVYITAAAYQDSSSGAAITDSNGNFISMSVSSFNLYTDQYDFSYSGTQIVYDEIMFVKKELCKTHTPVYLPERASDCMREGLTAGSYCSVCNTVLEEQKSVPRTAHTPKNLVAAAPSCSSTGLSSGSICSVCGVILVRQTTIDKIAHSYENGKCRVCGAEEVSGFTIGGVSLNDYVIVYSGDAEAEEGTELSSMLNSILWEYLRVRLPVYSDKDPANEHEIRIGKACSTVVSDTFDYDVRFENGTLSISGGGCWAMYYALTLLEDGYFSKSVPIPADVNLSSNVYGKKLFDLADGSNLRVLDNNIWQNDSDSIPSAWKKLGADPTDKCRSKGLAEVVYAYMPDIVSLQEYSPHMDKYLRPLLEEYGYLLSYDPNGSSDFTPVFYNKNTVELITSVYHPYQPTTYNNGNTKSYNAGVFRLRSNGRVFGIVSTHLWYKTEKDFKGSNAARCDQVRTIIAEVEKLSERYNCPFFVMGDMNSAIGSDPMQIFLNNGFVHAHDTAILKTDDTLGAHDCDSSKFSRASTRTTDARVDGPIDQFFSYNLSKDDKILVFDRVDPYFFICLSDHYPVVVDLYLSE